MGSISKKEKRNKLPYSYHTFLFPFIWKTDPAVRREDFERIIDTEKRWKKCVWSELIDPSGYEPEKNEWFWYYQAYQYFTDAANNVIFDANGAGIVCCYEYYKKTGTYSIHKKEKDEEKSKETGETVWTDKVYSLDVNRIRLNVYEAGFAILIFELENKENRSVDDVNAINEYGRRVNFPYLMKPDPEHPEGHICHTLCADKIVLDLEDGEIYEEDFLDTLMNIHERIKNDQISMTYVMSPVQDLLDGNISNSKDSKHNKFTANIEHAKSDPDLFYIKPCTDDRMFVCCAVRDNALSSALQEITPGKISFISDADQRMTETITNSKGETKVLDKEGKEHEGYMEKWSDEKTLSSRLYKLLFIENDLTCQEAAMKTQLLLRSVYRRWLNAGTVFGVTHHAMICLNNGFVDVEVTDPFLTEYVQMAILVLAQRAAILMLEDEASDVSNRFNYELEIKKVELEDIEKLQVKYVKIQNQLLLSEITVQEQGVELYQMLREQLYIGKNMADLNTEMDNLRDIYNIANAQQERESDKAKEEHDKKMLDFETRKRDDENSRINRLTFILALIGICEPAGIIFTNHESGRKFGVYWAVFMVGFFCAVMLIFSVISRRKGRLKDMAEKKETSYADPDNNEK